MTHQRFACTACGACCHGILPLNIAEALAWADQFPLAISITPVRANTRGFKSLGQVGVNVPIGARKTMPMIIWPVSFIPPNAACPKLAPDKSCAIHHNKPQRCRTIPFVAYKDEDSQRDQLVPRAGWECDVGPNAPIVYRDFKIVDRDDFVDERSTLKTEAPKLQQFVDFLIRYDAATSARLMKAAQAPQVGRVVIAFASYLRHLRHPEITGFANKQYGVLEAWVDQTSHDQNSDASPLIIERQWLTFSVISSPANAHVLRPLGLI